MELLDQEKGIQIKIAAALYFSSSKNRNIISNNTCRIL